VGDAQRQSLEELSAWASASDPHTGRPRNLQFDILPAVTFVTIAAASLSAQRPLLAVVVRFVRTLQTTCSRGSGPPVDQRGQVFTSNQAWTAGILP